MKTFVTVIQTTATKFDVFKFSGATQKSIYPQTNKLGVVVSVWESSDQNDKYCFELAEKMNNGNI